MATHTLTIWLQAPDEPWRERVGARLRAGLPGNVSLVTADGPGDGDPRGFVVYATAEVPAGDVAAARRVLINILASDRSLTVAGDDTDVRVSPA